MKVSAVIPTYNRGRVVGRAVESALAQTYSDLEVLVVDDGSTDDAATWMSSLDDPRLRYVRRLRCPRYTWLSRPPRW